jgi:hypothetical protein
LLFDHNNEQSSKKEFDWPDDQIQTKHNHGKEVCMEHFVLFATLVFCTAMFLCAPAAHAWQTSDPWIQKRFVNQEQRINRGIASGKLNPHETANLLAAQTNIMHHEMAMRSDGRLTGKERFQLHHALNHSNRAIYSMKHNGL